MEGGITRMLKYKLNDPFNLSIEITGKILGNNYPELISINTIMKCFERLNAIGVCMVDPAKMMNAEVVKCDITKDVPIENIPALTRYIKGTVRNYDAFICTKFRNGNLVVEKSVTTHKRKRRITIYDKGHEMNLHEEQPFVSDNGLEGEYDGICRFEMNLTSKKQIREALNITGNTLTEVLQSKKNPIKDFLGDILAEDTSGKAVSSWKDFEKYAILAICGFDLAKVEAKAREYKNPRSTSIPKMMAQYREILAGLPSKAAIWSKDKLLNALR